MKITLITVGKPRQKYIIEGVAEYVKRLSGFTQCTLVHIQESDIAESLKKYLKRATLVLLDEKGTEYRSAAFAAYLAKKELQSQNLVFLIGGTDGHIPSVRALPHETLSLTKLTLPHELALLVFVETLYRSLTITAGHPYHRE
jgi:23S rRNA (pseudouridine1915-N3)-methyltransferase